MATHRRNHILITLLALLALLPFAASTPAFAIGGTVIVNSLSDSANDNANTCTIREALQGISLAKSNSNITSYQGCTGIQAGTNTIINTITFTVSGKINVTGANGGSLPDISSNITISGPIIFDGTNNANSPIFRLSSSDTIFNMLAITVMKGSPAILMTTNSAILNIAGSSFIGNVNSGNGGAINGGGKINIAGTNFTGNQSTGGTGGAISTTGTEQLNIAGSVFNGNIAKKSGGAIFSGSPGTIVDTIFNGNIAQGSDPNGDNSDNQFDDYFTVGGGALYNNNDGGNGRKMVVIRSVFNGNIAAPYGNAGAIYNTISSVVEVRDSSFNGNISGSIGNDRQGGAILNAGAKLALDRVTFMANIVTGSGGGIAFDRTSPVTVTNSLFVANTATVKGGGLYVFNTQQGSNQRPQITLLNDTIAQNTAAQGGGIYGQDPNNSYPEVTILGNTIISGSDATGGNCAGGPFTSRGHNLDSGTSCGLTGAGNLQSANAALQAPSFNGGPLAELLSMKLGGASAALDAADPAICAADPVGNVDQRGTTRGGDGNGDGTAGCDIGSYEGDALKAGYGSTPVQPGPIDIGNVQVGTTGQTTFTIFSTGNKDLQVSAQLQGANANEFAIVSFPSTISSTAPATISCSPTGSPGARTAGLAVTTNDPAQPIVSYQLLCNATAVPVAGFSSVPAAPGPIDTGTIVIGQNKTTNLQFQETGNAALSITSMQLTGPNAAEFTVLLTNVAIANGGAAVNRTITCAPTAPGIRTATFSMTTNDPTSPSVSFNLSCTGKAPPTPLIQAGTSYAGIPADQVGPYGLALSPDGRNLYVANDGAGTLMIYDRDTVTSALSNPRSITGLNGAIRVLASPDGQNVYLTAGGTLDQVRAYARNSSSGDLAILDTVTENDSYGCFFLPCDGTVNGLSNAYGMALSPDGKYLYVSGIGNTASPENRSIVILQRSSDGGLRGLFGDPNYVGAISSPLLIGTYDLAISPDGGYLYAANYGGNPDSIVAFKRNTSTGLLTALPSNGSITATTVPKLAGVFRLEFSADGSFLYASSYDSDAIVVLKRNPVDGTLSHVVSYTDGGLDDDNATIDGLASASSAKVSPDGRYLFTTGFADNAVTVFERDETTGRLVFVQTIKRNGAGLPPLLGARDLAISSDGKAVYASGHDDDKIVTLVQPNPVPALTSLSPASATAGPGAIVLTVNGSGFVNGSVVRWNNAIDLPTTFISSSELHASVGVGLLTNAGTRAVTVRNPAPGGGFAVNSLTFTITAPAQNPVPSIEQISPQGAPAGGPALSITVSGAGFINSSQVLWNGVARLTTYISGSTLQVQVNADDVDQPGAAAITVVNPAPGGGTSNAVGFTVATPGQNPLPALDHISPASSVAAQTGGLLTVSLYGAGFVDGATAQWDGTPRPTTFVSATELQLELNGSDVDAAGQHSVAVVNPAPGGGESNAVAYTVVGIGSNPLPTLGALHVQTLAANGTITLAVDGSGFVAGVQARWNGAARTTSLASPTRILVTLTNADFVAGSGVLTTSNPAPGGGTSNELLFVVRQLMLPISRK